MFEIFSADTACVKGGSHSATVLGNKDKFPVENSAVADKNSKVFFKFDLKSFPFTRTACAILKLPLSIGYDEYASSLQLYGVYDNNWQRETICWDNSPKAGGYIATRSVDRHSGDAMEWDVTDFINSSPNSRCFSFMLVKGGLPDQGCSVWISNAAGTGRTSLIVAGETERAYSHAEYTRPFWLSGVMCDEPVIMLSKEGNLPEASLMYNPERILTVKDPKHTHQYLEGIDWVYEDGKLMLLPGSAANFMTDYQFQASNLPPEHSWPPFADKRVLFYEGHYFHDQRIDVTYSCTKPSAEAFFPKYSPQLLPLTISKLEKKEPIKLILYGDSISEGANASGFTGAPPYLQSWGRLITEELERVYGSKIIFMNPSHGGRDAVWADINVESLVAVEKPDLVIIAHGMNNSHTPDDMFKSRIVNIMTSVRAYNGKAEFILVQSMVPNPELSSDDRVARFLPVLMSLVSNGTAVADMTSIHKYLLTRKKYIDLAGNNVNHPNDFLVRVYAQVILSLLVNYEP